MKKFLCLFVICFTFLNSIAFASGVQTPPQSERNVQPLIPMQKISAPVKPESNVIKQNVTQVPPFNPVVEPIQKAPDTKKALEGATSADIPCYEKISLPKAIDYALTHNLDIIGNRLNVDIDRNNVKVANRLRNPYFISYFNFGKAATENPNYTGLQFPIDIAKRGPRKKLAKSNLELTKGNVALAELTLRLDVRQAYVDVVASKSTLKILNDQRKLLQELLYVAQKKYAAGAVPQMDVIQAKMTLNQLLIQVNSANTDVYVARYKFNMLLDPIKCNFDTVEDYLPEQNEFISMLTPKPLEKMPPFEEVLNIMITKRIDLINAKRDIDIAKKNLVVVTRQRIPDIEIGGGYLFDPPQMTVEDTFTQGVYLMGNITNIPLLYQYTPEIKNAKLQIEQKILAYKNLEHDDTLALHSAYDAFNTARDNLNYYNDILLSESKQFLGMAKRSYEVGKSNITDLIFIEQSYKSIIMGYVQALADYYDAWVEVLRQVNDEELKLNG